LIPLSTEYLIFMVVFASMAFAGYGLSGLKSYSLPVFFLGAIGGLYTIDNFYPWGTFTPFQMITPTTTSLAAGLLNWLGYHTSIFIKTSSDGVMPYLTATNSKGTATFGVAWPCAGVESLLIYGVTILLFLGNSPIRWRTRALYFSVGAVVTYFINVLRIATIFMIAIDSGWRPNYMPPEVQRFHDYYGMLYSTSWIVLYPLIIMGSQALWRKTRSWKAEPKNFRPIT
jgi:thaumarchaeosortase